MAAPPMSPARKRARLADPATAGGVLSTDELQEVLLRLPSKPLGRLRTVCRSWRSLLSAPHFVAAHAARRLPAAPDTLLVSAAYDAADLSRVGVRLVDPASGAVVCRLDGLGAGCHLGATGGLLCLVGAHDGALRVLDPATGAVTELPAGEDTAVPAHGPHASSAYVFGQVPVTGDYKMLHVYTVPGEPNQLCEILTLGTNGDGGDHERRRRWKPAGSPPMRVETSISRNRVVTQGVSHFLSPHTIECDSVASFDLNKEEWRPALIRGPLSGDGRHCFRSHLSLAELNGCLFMVHHNYRGRCMDLYMLSDMEKGTWSRMNSLHFESILRGWEDRQELRVGQPVTVSRDQECVAQPLMMLEDGRIALWVGAPNGVLRVHDPSTGACKEVAKLGKGCSIVGLYTGSLLRFM